MDLNLTGKTALVTGASRGIGLATAKALAAEGVQVFGAARTISDELRETAAATASVDLSTQEGAEGVVRQAIRAVGGIDILINNVGAGDVHDLSLGGFVEAPDVQWQRMFALNLFSPMWTTRAAVPSLLERGGAVINLSSVNSRIPANSPVGYSEAKAALTMLSKRLSEELGPQGVRVNTVSPGVVGSSLWRDPQGFGAQVAAAAGMPHEDFLAAVPQLFGMASPRITEPEEVAALICFLVSDRAANLIGADVSIDGGTLKTA